MLNTDKILRIRQAQSRHCERDYHLHVTQSRGLLFYCGADDDTRLISSKVLRLWVTPPPLGIIPKSVARWQKFGPAPAGNQIQSFQRHETSGPAGGAPNSLYYAAMLRLGADITSSRWPQRSRA